MCVQLLILFYLFSLVISFISFDVDATISSEIGLSHRLHYRKFATEGYNS